MVHIYQTVIILDPTNEAIAKEEIRKFTDILQGCSHRKKVKVEDMGEKRLAYEMKSHKSGWYCVFTSELHPEDIAEIERQLRIDDHVLKFMTIRTEDEEDELEDYDEASEKSEQDHPAASSAEIDLFDLIFSGK
jgi:small subunit ribosomal protein S6